MNKLNGGLPSADDGQKQTNGRHLDLDPIQGDLIEKTLCDISKRELSFLVGLLKLVLQFETKYRENEQSN